MTDFEDEPTREIPRETMSLLIYGVEGFAPSGPDRPTRDMRPLRHVEDDVSDGIPVVPAPAGDDTAPAWIPRASTVA